MHHVETLDTNLTLEVLISEEHKSLHNCGSGMWYLYAPDDKEALFGGGWYERLHNAPQQVEEAWRIDDERLAQMLLAKRHQTKHDNAANT